MRGKRDIPKVHFTLPQASTLVIELPDPPSVNRIWRKNPNGGMYLSPLYKAWRKQADMALMVQKALKAVRGPVVLTVTFPDKGRRDLDNLQKVVSDFLVHHGIIEDDKRDIVREIRLGWHEEDCAAVEVKPAYAWIQRRDACAKAMAAA